MVLWTNFWCWGFILLQLQILASWSIFSKNCFLLKLLFAPHQPRPQDLSLLFTEVLLDMALRCLVKKCVFFMMKDVRTWSWLLDLVFLYCFSTLEKRVGSTTFSEFQALYWRCGTGIRMRTEKYRDLYRNEHKPTWTFVVN